MIQLKISSFMNPYPTTSPTSAGSPSNFSTVDPEKTIR